MSINFCMSSVYVNILEFFLNAFLLVTSKIPLQIRLIY